MTDNNEQENLKNIIVAAILDKKGKELTILNLNKLDQSIADYFVICHGDSNTQVDAITDSVDRQARIELQEHPLHIEGKENAQWILMDYGSVVVHIFQKEYREFYNLEGLWADASKEIINIE